MKTEFYSAFEPESDPSGDLARLRRFVIVPEPAVAVRVRLSQQQNRCSLPISAEGDVWIGQLIWWSTLAEKIGTHQNASLLRPTRRSRGVADLLVGRRYESDRLTMVGDLVVLLSSGNWGSPPCGALVVATDGGRGDALTTCNFAASPIEDGLGSLIWARPDVLEKLGIEQWIHGRWSVTGEQIKPLEVM